MSPTSKSPKPPKHQRRVKISVVLPMIVELIVGTNENDPSDESDWQILKVLSTRCADVTPRTVTENMHNEDFEALAAAAAKAEDLP